ncbi:BNR repeat protein [Mucilaginibacter gracilis]|uniref:BNR repeat protein n=1 Tax=Mucilaginibacter gracilis TaxID=423350 RepID=A0A495J7J3_9SPHI|nr:exo-alpha-sialidase [Mucilaginibacter gracilis]RKR84334.1 BNR repeat protein [Mucilaginibacter gracilis]
MRGICNIALLLVTCCGFAHAQDTVHYTGNTVVNVDYHHGQLSPAIGVHSTQILRANREHPELADGFGFTYNHAPMLSYWNNTFYVEYLSDKVGESVPPGQTLVVTSKDGQTWSKPEVVFPQYKIPDGTTKPGHSQVAKDLFSVMHQRMGFYQAKSKRLFVLGFYGICLEPHDDPNDGLGIGRVVREVLPNGKYGPIYFLHYNPKWNEQNTLYPFYKTSKDKGFIQACDELMATPLMMMQWAEETDRNDPLIPLHKDYKAFNFYHLPDGRTVGLWKNALTSISKDDGKTWGAVTRAPRFVNSNAKIWGQKTSDGKYATVYNPSEFRWPLAISVSRDGLDYTNLLLVNGEISTMRYGGAYKSYGPQYVRGIEEGNGVVPDGKLWVTYSMNKEDIWVSSIPVPVTDVADAHANEDFNTMPAGRELDKWNTFSPQWAKVQIEKMVDGTKALALHDEDKFDYARAERVVPESKKLLVDFTVVAGQNSNGMLDIEFQNAKGDAAIRLTLDSTGAFISKAGYRAKSILKKYEANKAYHIILKLNTDARFYYLNIDGKDLSPGLFFAPVLSVKRVVFRTGGVRRFPNADTPTDQDYDLPQAGERDKPAVFYIKSFSTQNF